MPPHTSVTYPLAPEELENLQNNRKKKEKKERFSIKGIYTNQKRRRTGRTLPAHVFTILSTSTSVSTVHPLFPKQHFQVWGTPVLFQCLVLVGFTGPESPGPPSKVAPDTPAAPMAQPPSPTPTPGPPPVPTGEVRCSCNQTLKPPYFHPPNNGLISMNNHLLCTDTAKNEVLLRKPH